MSDQKGIMQNFIGELRNRRVFRVATVYLGVGFALLEACDILVPSLGLPGVTVLVVLGMLMIGFPIAVILAWHYQFTPEGIRKSPKTGEKQTADQKPLTSNAIIIVLLIIIAGLLAYPRVVGDSEARSSAVLEAAIMDPKSIAVLPFTSFTDEREDEIFADGMHDDILTQLSKIKDLRVVSRTTMMKYKDTEKSISEIAGEVGVANLLEGSVRRAGDQVRIVAQLIKAQSDEHLWAETYDRDYADIFSVQSDVARKIAGALKSALTPEENDQLDEIPTQNMEAYDYFLKGNYYWHTKTTKEGNMQAVAMYDEAIKLDPDFGLAYARQSIAHSVLYQQPAWDPTLERKALAKASLDKALRLIPNHPETHFAHGIYFIWCLEDRQSAIIEFEKAAEGQAKNSEIANHLGQLYMEAGEWDKARYYLERAYDLDPDALGNAGWLGGWHSLHGNFDEAEKYYKESVQKFPEIAVPYRFYAEVMRYGFGDIEASRKILRDGVIASGNPGRLAPAQIQTEVEARDYAKALEIGEANYRGDFPTYYKTVIHHHMGESQKAKELIPAARAELISVQEEQPDLSIVYSRQGVLAAIEGREEEALRFANEGIELMPPSRDAMAAPMFVYYRAFINSILGHSDAAVDDLEYLLSIPSGHTPWDIRLNPFFDPIRDNPRFQRLIHETGQSS